MDLWQACYEHCSGRSCSIKDGEFPDHLTDFVDLWI
jgi:hypothetical protein